VLIFLDAFSESSLKRGVLNRVSHTAVCITIVKNATFNRAPKNASDPFHDLQSINNLRTTTLEWERNSLN
jgi:hypothetical protein